ncbi:putative permease [Colletotrichum fructicola]|uniref:Ncs1 allantoate transporter n=1 Tax=Colletotrichum fructicola (strain Nara gc5) TaxID=1213859 RepID=L2GAX5_COLFN|nr:putative permease [Colletotrichum fructicola]KAF4476014.1 putative permease [Colletotrichum fructicola Nara gc5]KAE9567129.1 putative permease [Colletotrichum fructicola]KAF4419401.1 putative permease [Colletotrichum fructicola]KAF4883149.1 putative permease [Colletotrichum fructicola]KAF4904021.1 putative permease [Colletotrichum fructicola]
MENMTYRERGQAAKEKIKLRLAEPTSWKLSKQESSIAPPEVWTNADMDPVPPERRTWGKGAFITYWFSDLVTISTWNTGAAIVTTGLSATDAILIVLVAGICNAIPTVLNGAIGSDLHIPFPIASRASFGYWFSYFAVVSRGILAMFWFGVQTAGGATCVTSVIAAIWPSFKDIPNHLPASAGLTTVGMISYLIYWLIQFPLLLIPTHKLQKMFWVKTFLTPPMALAMVIWISLRAGGGGDFLNKPSQVHGSERAWLWLSNLTSVTGGYSTLAVNIADFSRFSKERRSQVWQLPVIPFFKTIVALFGVISASAAQEIWGVTYWTPLEIISTWQNTAGGRAAGFICASIWLLAQISVNISANAVSFANDITTVAPKWFNIRRGTVFVAFIGGWALCPWIIVASGKAFINFMSAYAIFMAPMAGILFTDYWLIKRKKYDVPALYNPNGIYSYGKYGTNWRASLTMVLVIIPVMPGLAAKVSPTSVHIDQGLANLFSFNWLYGFFLSIFIYYFSNIFFPHKPTLLSYVVTGFGDIVHGVEADSESQTAEGKEKLGTEVDSTTKNI